MQINMWKEIIKTVQEFNPGIKQLRVFGIVLGLVCILIYGTRVQSALLLIFAAIAVLLAVIKPRAYLPLVKILLAVTYPIGWILSRVLLVIFFFCVLV